MRWNNSGYATCVHSKKRKCAPWKVLGSCESPNRLFTGKSYELPSYTECIHCPFYCEDIKRKQ